MIKLKIVKRHLSCDIKRFKYNTGLFENVPGFIPVWNILRYQEIHDV